MGITFDYHTHTTWSHGKGSILDNAISAKNQGMAGLAITDHGEAHPIFGIKRKNFDIMTSECKKASEETGLIVKLGVEANLLGESGKIDVIESDFKHLDVLLVGFHRCIWYESLKAWGTFFAGNFFISGLKLKPSDTLVKQTTKAYINAIKKYPIDAISHINYLCYSDIVEVAKACSDYGTVLEISTKKTHIKDSDWEGLLKTDVNFIVNSDAHSPSRVGDIKLFNELQERIEIPEDRILNINGKVPTLRLEQYKKKM